MERMKLTEKEKEQILKSGAEAMSRIIEKMSIEMGELEEENKKLKKECEENDYLVEDNARWMKKCEEKTKEIKKLKEELDKLEMELGLKNLALKQLQEGSILI